jgi:hypothetical protein
MPSYTFLQLLTRRASPNPYWLNTSSGNENGKKLKAQEESNLYFGVVAYPIG